MGRLERVLVRFRRRCRAVVGEREELVVGVQAREALEEDDADSDEEGEVELEGGDESEIAVDDGVAEGGYDHENVRGEEAFVGGRLDLVQAVAPDENGVDHGKLVGELRLDLKHAVEREATETHERDAARQQGVPRLVPILVRLSEIKQTYTDDHYVAERVPELGNVRIHRVVTLAPVAEGGPQLE